MDLVELARGLWRWLAPHPDWKAGAEPGSPGDWERDVGSVFFESPGAAVFIDPLLPSEPQRLFRMLDKRVARLDRAVVLTTIRWHRRSRDAFVERYGATSQAPGRLPAGVEAFPVPAARETMFWLPAPRALVPGDALLTRAGDGLRLCPTSWLRALGSPTTRQELAVALEPLLDLPIELIVTSHGPPVLSGGRRELARALAHGRRSAPPP